MLITFLRHATAEDRRLTTPDAERALTEKGEKQMKRVAAFCQTNRLFPTAIYCSPLLRAQQTARILHERLTGCPTPETVEWLGSDTSPQIIMDELNKLASNGMDDVWLVGHEPDFSETIGHLLQTHGDNFEVKKASLTRLDVDFTIQSSAKLLWSLPCGLMR